MSTITELDYVPATEEDFHYGWRYVEHRLPNGRIMITQIPLTLNDLLHPQEGDEVPHSTAHQRRIHYLRNVFLGQLEGVAGAVVLDDVLIAWDVPGLKPHSPDMMVIFGVRKLKNWSTFVVAEEGVRPDLIVEVTSPETRALDLKSKVAHYARAGVPRYVIIDSGPRQKQKQEQVRLLDYQLREGAYVLQPLDARGWLWLEAVQVWLGAVDGEIACFDRAGTQIGDYAILAIRMQEAVSRADQAEAQAQVEAAARAQAEDHIRALQAELRRLRGEET